MNDANVMTCLGVKIDNDIVDVWVDNLVKRGSGRNVLRCLVEASALGADDELKLHGARRGVLLARLGRQSSWL